jgi:hypothetical protein
MSYSSTGYIRNDRNRPREADAMSYRVGAGDVLIQDILFRPETIRRGLDILAQRGAGELAYTPEMVHKFEEILERRYNDDDGGNTFEMPNYAPYEDPNLAMFYGANTSVRNFRTAKETLEQTVNRLLLESANEASIELPGLVQQMNWYAVETWPRVGVTEENFFVQPDSDTTIFRNPDHGWSTIDRPISTADRSNVIQMYAGPGEQAVGGHVVENLYPTPHPGWLVDTRNPFW